jgi:hypothetical protein
MLQHERPCRRHLAFECSGWIKFLSIGLAREEIAPCGDFHEALSVQLCPSEKEGQRMAHAGPPSLLELVRRVKCSSMDEHAGVSLLPGVVDR